MTLRWLIGLAVLFAAAFVLRSGLMAYALYVLTGVFLLGRLIVRNGLNRVTAERSVDRDEITAGEAVVVSLSVRNGGWLPIVWVILEDLLPEHVLRRRPPMVRVQGRRLQIRTLRAGRELDWRYKLECPHRGYYQIGPLILETGDLFGLHRRHRAAAEPAFLLVLPRVVALRGYDVASRRPIGDIKLTLKLYEDPTRIAGVRPYEHGDPLNRVHWKATARTGKLHSKVFDPSTMAGATILLDLHAAGYPERGEPVRSDLAATAVASLAQAITLLGQPVGLATNGRDAAARIAVEGSRHRRHDATVTVHRHRGAARAAAVREQPADQLKPLVVETRRGDGQVLAIRQTLARAEVAEGLTFAELVREVLPRLPRDASVIAVLSAVPVATALTLGELRRRGFAVTVVLIAAGDESEEAVGRLYAERVRDVRPVNTEGELADLCEARVSRAPYALSLG